jgi:ribose 1,5-bisphosphokinase
MAELFYVMGASGVGKDSLLDYARQHLAKDDALVFAHRYITRPANAGNENHIALSEHDFQRRLNQGCFAMNWDSHGLRYGIGIDINQWLAKGLNVVMNGSRAYLQQAFWTYPELKPVLIHVDQATLRQRLEARGRESAAEIEQRLERARLLDDLQHPNLIVINNDGDLSVAGDKLIMILTGKKRTCA